ncbi:MAG: pitrilysin family protein [Candidatus Omnitrophica bacterium]|nr:pitrilysin family protein [Candidatus Omnitrophota bacterium]
MRILYLFILLCLIATAVFIFHPGVTPRYQYEDSVHSHTLDNGLTVITKSAHKVPLAAVRLIIKAGSATEGKFSGSGISHFVEHMLFKGTAGLPVGEIERRIKSYGGYINAQTSHDTTEVHLIVKSEYLDKALSLLSDFVFNASFDESEFVKEKDVILNEIRMGRDEPSRRASYLLWESAYLVHPYRYPVIGYEDLLRQISRQGLVEYHASKYTPDNCVLSVVGDIDEAAALRACENTLGRLPRRAGVVPLKPAEPLQMSVRRADAQVEGLKLSYLLIAFHTTSLADKDLYPMDLLAAALGQGESSRLYNILVKEKKLAYAVSSSNYTPFDPGLFVVSMRLEEGNIDAALKEVRAEIKRIKAHSLRGRELEKVKRSVLADYIYGKESIGAQANDYASGYASTGDYNFSRKYIDGLGAVKPAGISKAAAKYLNDENMTVVTLVPKKGAPVLEPAAGTPKKEFDVRKVVLQNGAVVLFDVDRSLPVVSMSVVFKGGVRAEDEKTNGISRLFSDVLVKGTSSRSAEWLSETTESRGILFGGFSGKNSFGISLKCLKEDFGLSLGIVSDILKNAAFPEKELKISKEQQLAAIRSREDDIFAVASKELIKTIFISHPYGMPDLGEKGPVSALTRADLMDYYKRYVVPGNMVVSVFGDIDAATQKRVEEAFGSLKKTAFKDIVTINEQEQLAPRKDVKEMNKEQAVLMLGYPGVDVKNPDRYALDVINSILSREGGRLYRDIREKLGLSYTLGSFSVFGLDPGYNAFYVATTPKNIPDARNIILGHIRSLKAEGPTQEEMELAKSDLLGGYFRGIEVNSDVAFKAALDELYGIGYDDIFKYPEMIKAVDAQEVMQVAKRYFIDSRLNEVMILPAAGPAKAKSQPLSGAGGKIR